MFKRKRNLTSHFLLFLFVFTSCVKDVDFNQAENVVLSPVLVSSIVYSEVEASRFFVDNEELSEVTDTIENIEVFEEQFVNDNLVKVELVFEAINSINRSFVLQVDFLDNENELQHTLSFTASASSNEDSVVTSFTEVFEESSLEALKLTTKLSITITINPSEDGSTLNDESTGKIELKSKGLFYFNINL